MLPSEITLKNGDLIRFSGEYYEVLDNGQLMWVMSKLTREGLVIGIDGDRASILSEGGQFSIGFDSHCDIELISRTGENNGSR